VVPDDDLLAADAILCWRNSTRHELNRMSRELRGLASPLPQAGEPVLCFKNAARFNVWNGGVYTLLRSFSPFSTTIVVDVEGVETEIPKVEFEGITPKGNVKFPTTTFGFGYTLTVHKAQGSEFPSVLLVDEMPKGREERTSWLYAGITRAAERILVVNEEARS
jgi:exodeoxyribonuclease-5